MNRPTGVRRGWERKHHAPIGSETELIAALDTWLPRDPHGDGTYRVHSLYFDTPDLAVHRRCPVHGQAKLRLRRYDEAPTVFLERKAKDADGWVDKVRTALPAAQLARPNLPDPDDFPDIAWFADLLAAGGFEPKQRIACHRIAWEGDIDGRRLRITLDTRIRADAPGAVLLPGPLPEGRPLTDRPLIEVKGDRDCPATVDAMLARLGAVLVDFSKYRRSMESA